MTRLLALLAFLTLTGFLGVLIWEVPHLDLSAIIVITVLFVAWDMLSSSGRSD